LAPAELSPELIPPLPRTEAIADGALLDHTKWVAADTGMLEVFVCSVAVMAAAWQEIDAIPPRAHGLQSVQ